MEKSVFKGKIIKVATEPKIIKSTRVVFERVYLSGSVHILPITKQGKIRLIKERKFSHKGEVVTKIVSGRIEKNEKPLASAKRELKEELGLVASKWQLFKTVKQTGTVNDVRYYYITKDLKSVEANNDETEEILGHVDYSISQLYKKAINGDFSYSPSALIIIQLYHQRKELL